MKMKLFYLPLMALLFSGCAQMEDASTLEGDTTGIYLNHDVPVAEGLMWHTPPHDGITSWSVTQTFYVLSPKELDNMRKQFPGRKVDIEVTFTAFMKPGISDISQGRNEIRIEGYTSTGWPINAFSDYYSENDHKEREITATPILFKYDLSKIESPAICDYNDNRGVGNKLCGGVRFAVKAYGSSVFFKRINVKVMQPFN